MSLNHYDPLTLAPVVTLDLDFDCNAVSAMQRPWVAWN